MSRSDFRGHDDRVGPVYRLWGCLINGYDFSKAHCHGWDFRCSTINNAKFDGASLVGSGFENSALRDTSFRGADLTGCEFRWADLRRADFTGATLPGFRAFTGARLTGAKGIPARWIAWSRAMEADCMAENRYFWPKPDKSIPPRRRDRPKVVPFQKADRRRVAKPGLPGHRRDD